MTEHNEKINVINEDDGPLTSIMFGGDDFVNAESERESHDDGSGFFTELFQSFMRRDTE